MIAIERITAENVAMFKAVRLRALQDTPQAFSATYAQESRLTDEEWLQRTQRWNDGREGFPRVKLLIIELQRSAGLLSRLRPGKPRRLAFRLILL